MSISTQIITFDFKLFLGNAIKSLSIDLIKIKARPTAVTLTLRQAIPLPSNKRLKQFFHHKQLTYFTAALEWSDPETDFQSVLSVINTQEEPLSISDLIKHENAIQDACFYRDKIIIIMSNDWSCERNKPKQWEKSALSCLSAHFICNDLKKRCMNGAVR